MDPYQYPELWVERCLEHLAEVSDVLIDDEVFRPLCVEYGPYGVHFIDKMLGADVFQQDGQWYSHYLDTSIGKLTMPDLETNETWLLARRAANAFTNQKLELPLFGLPTIASSLNIAVNLYGEKILLALYDEPEKAVHDLKIINTLLCSLHRWYLQNIPIKQLQPVVSGHRTQPPGYGQLCGCTTQLVSGDLYRRYIAPLDDELLSIYPHGGMIHLCGSHTQHMPAWHQMSSLRAVQLNDKAAEELEQYYHGLREDQIIYFSPCQGITTANAIEVTGGNRLVIAGC
ncbi:MAG: hypothetical protein ACYC1M_01305 [Armatimonadota bacterium]